MTPLAPPVPYNPLAAGPSATCTVSTSCALISLRREGVCPPTPTDADAGPFSTRMPSTTSAGSFDRETLLEPRMRIRVPLPGVPPADCTTTPGTRALSPPDRFVIGDGGATFAASIVWIALL